MRNVFVKRNKDHTALRETAFPVLFFLTLVVMVTFGLKNVNQSTQAEQLKSAQQAVRRAVVQCYALEGQYPPNIEYLEQNYGLSVDRSKYVVHYQMFASNLLPEVSVFPANENVK